MNKFISYFKKIIFPPKKNLYEIEQVKILSLLNTLFETKHNKGYWTNRERYKNYLTPKRIKFFHNLNQHIKSHIFFDKLQGKNVLDVGFGSAYWIHFLSHQYPNLTYSGVELNSEAIEVFKQLVPNYSSVYHQNIYELTIPKHTLVFCTEVLEHLTKPDVVLEKLTKCVDKGGFLILTVPNGRQDTSEAGTVSRDGLFWTGHVNFWSPESWKHFITQNVTDCDLTFFTIQDYGYDKNGVMIKLN